MFVVLFGIISGIIFMVIAVTIALIIMIPSKISLTMIGKKAGLKNPALAWIPLVHGWYEGAMISYFWNKQKRNKSIHVIWTILHALMYVFPIIYCIIDGVMMENVHVLPDYMTTLLAIFMALDEAIYLALAIIKLIAMKKAGSSTLVAVLVGIFIPFYWTMFMFGKVEKIEKKDDAVIITDQPQA